MYIYIYMYEYIHTHTVVYVPIIACFTELQTYEPQNVRTYHQQFPQFVSRHIPVIIKNPLTNEDTPSFTRQAVERKPVFRIKPSVRHFFFNQRSGGKSFLCFPALGCVCELSRRRNCTVRNQQVSLLFCMKFSVSDVTILHLSDSCPCSSMSVPRNTNSRGGGGGGGIWVNV